MIRAKELRFSFPLISFSFPPIYCEQGKVLLVTGASGKGKTTLLHLLGGLLKPTSGIIEITGTDITSLKSGELDQFRGNNIGIIFQQPHFVAALSIIENLSLANSLAGKKYDQEKTMNLLQQLDIAEQANKKPSALSQGQLQRASMARAMMNEPPLVLADEPTSSLDDDNCYKVAALLEEQALQNNTALIIVTHDQRLKEIFHQSIQLI